MTKRNKLKVGDYFVLAGDYKNGTYNYYYRVKSLNSSNELSTGEREVGTLETFHSDGRPYHPYKCEALWENYLLQPKLTNSDRLALKLGAKLEKKEH